MSNYVISRLCSMASAKEERDQITCNSHSIYTTLTYSKFCCLQSGVFFLELARVWLRRVPRSLEWSSGQASMGRKKLNILTFLIWSWLRSQPRTIMVVIKTKIILRISMVTWDGFEFNISIPFTQRHRRVDALYS